MEDVDSYQVDLIIYVLRRVGSAPRRKLMKLLFLIDKELYNRFGVAVFHWKAYKYGPFSREVLDVLDAMELHRSVEGKVEDSDIVYELTTTASADLPQEVREVADKILDEWSSRSVDELAEYVNAFITPGRSPLAT
jgi:uncharacterized protein YwgA